MKKFGFLFVLIFAIHCSIKAQSQLEIVGDRATYNVLPKIVVTNAEGDTTYNPATNVRATVSGSDINITWNAPDAYEVILSEGFDSGIPANWTQIDANSDGYIWTHSTTVGQENPGSANSASYIHDVGAITPDNYLITPLVEGARRVSYWVAAHSTYYHYEHYAVMVSSTGTNASDFTVVMEETMIGKDGGTKNRNEIPRLGYWYKRTITLPAGTKYIAFRHYNCSNQMSLYLDDVTIYKTLVESYTITKNGDEIATGITETSYTDNDVAHGATYEYCVKAVYAEGISEPVCTTPINLCGPATNVQAVAEASDVTIIWDAPASGGSILLSEDFGSGIPAEWTQIDANDDGRIWTHSTGEGHYNIGSANSASYISSFGGIAPDNYLITPIVEGATSVNYWVAVHNTYYHAENYAVMASSTGTNATDFTVVFTETMIAKNGGTKDRNETPKLGTWYERTVTLPAGTKYIAFRHYDCYNQSSLYLDDVTVYGTDEVTYNVTKNGNEIATGII